MNPSFGALVKRRRKMLGYSPAYLAFRIRDEGHVVNVSLLERGEVTLSGQEGLRALANALQWPVPLLKAASHMLSGSAGGDHSTEQTMTDDAERPSEQSMVEELVGLEQLQGVLDEWAIDLARRADRLRSRPPVLGDDPFDL